MGQSQAVSRDEKPNGRQDPCLRTREPPLDLANDQLAKLEDTFPRLIPSLERSYLNEIRSAWRLRPWAPLLLAATSITDAPRLLAITRIRERLRPYLARIIHRGGSRPPSDPRAAGRDGWPPTGA